MKTTELRGDELPVTDEMRAQAFWLVQRYSSYTYLKRVFEVFSAFVTGYEGYAKINPSDDAEWHRDNLAAMYADRLALRGGLELLSKGQSAAYREIRKGLCFVTWFECPRFGDYRPTYLEEAGFRKYPGPHVGLWAWIGRAIQMATRARTLLMAMGALPQLLRAGPYHFPPNLPPMPKPRGVRVRHGGEFPIAGIWLPVSFPNGCPTYLCPGDHGPEGQRLALRLDDPPMHATKWTPAEPARTRYIYEPAVTDWELLWEDHRYRTGQIPDESAYLDETTEDPPYPPRYEPAKHLHLEVQ